MSFQIFVSSIMINLIFFQMRNKMNDGKSNFSNGNNKFFKLLMLIENKNSPKK